jgi:hypothetical protein
MLGSSILIESSTHGRGRREQRNICKRDLAAAVKYGVQERGFPHPHTGETRWKYTFAGIVYITDETSTREITSWALELPFDTVTLSDRVLTVHNEGKLRVIEDKSSITSHTIIVVDTSGSMRQSDMNGHRSRLRGVYYALAKEFLEGRLYAKDDQRNFGFHSNYSDVVSLIEFSDTSSIVFECEPCSWVLHNRFVSLSDGERARSHGCYFDAIKAAFELLIEYSSSNKCAGQIFFMSDGRPSDKSRNHNIWPNPFPENMYCYIQEQSALYGSRLNFTTYGFGKSAAEFEVLQQMVEYAKLGGAQGSFGFSFQDNEMLRSLISSSQQSLINTRTMLTRIVGNEEHDSRSFDHLKKTSSELDKMQFNHINYDFFNTTGSGPQLRITRFERKYQELHTLRGKYHKPILAPAASLQHTAATGFVVSKFFFGRGAERLAFYMTEIDSSNQPVGEPMVAKTSKADEERKHPSEVKDWHNKFLNVQHKVEGLAKKFNQRMDQLGISSSIPRIMFLPCSIYEAHSPITGETKIFLVEPRLHPSLYRKWNSNNGDVDGHRKINEPRKVQDLLITEMYEEDIAFRKTAIVHGGLKKLQAVNEEDEEDEEVDTDDDFTNQIESNEEESILKGPTFLPSTKVRELQSRILEDDIPQAFSHYTYAYSKRELLVCDLQGELQISSGRHPVFRFTDPSIHSQNTGMKKHRFGSTDHGKDGIYAFFRTHHCNVVCELLNLCNRKEPSNTYVNHRNKSL